jgi:hypothetical protein
MLSSDLIASVKRKIMFPVSQGTFSESDILAFANEEMMISQVPSVLEYHEEYFVFSKLIPLVSNVSRYTIPNRSIGMRLRDLNWADSSGNLNEMTRINADDKAFFSRNLGTNQSIAKYFLEGNDVVLTPSVISAPTGSLNFTFFIRPNQLVEDNRAAIIENFIATTGVSASALTVGDQLTVLMAQETPNVVDIAFTVTQRLITSNSIANPTVITVPTPHGQTIGSTFAVYISEIAGSSPSVSGAYTATATGTNTFTVPVNVTVAGTGGYYSLVDEFTIGSTDIQTASNLAASLQASLDVTANNNSSSTVTITYTDISLELSVSVVNATALTIDTQNIFINFDQLPTTWTDPTTNVTTPLYVVNEDIDFLQTKPGHKTYNFDVQLMGISGTVGEFLRRDLQFYSSTGTGSTLAYLPIVVGDYICLANECIIPQIPPDLHNGLAERTAARILAAIGDQQGLDRMNGKIQEINKSQGTLLDQRVDGSPNKVFARHSLLRYGKFNSKRRM